MLRIVSAAALVVVVIAGCGGGGRPQVAVHGVPAALAQKWEDKASAIAAAASAGDSCGALRLANALRSDVSAQQHRLPRRLRSPLITGVDALAARITCTVKPKPPHKPPGHKPDHHDKHGHGKHGHGDGGGGNDQ